MLIAVTSARKPFSWDFPTVTAALDYFLTASPLHVAALAALPADERSGVREELSSRLTGMSAGDVVSLDSPNLLVTVRRRQRPARPSRQGPGVAAAPMVNAALGRLGPSIRATPSNCNEKGNCADSPVANGVHLMTVEHSCGLCAIACSVVDKGSIHSSMFRGLELI